MKKGSLKKRKPSIRNRNNKLDALCRLAVLTRDHWRCQRCGGGNPQWCHVYSRRYLLLRWDMNNSVALCARDHWWWHDRPLEAAAWWNDQFSEKIGASRENLSARLHSGDKPDFQAIEDTLKACLRDYGILMPA